MLTASLTVGHTTLSFGQISQVIVIHATNIPEPLLSIFIESKRGLLASLVDT
jgi:hypothetical protein